MAKIRIYEIAKELKIQPKEVVGFLKEKNIEGKVASSSIEDETIAMVRQKSPRRRQRPRKQRKEERKGQPKREGRTQNAPRRRRALQRYSTRRTVKPHRSVQGVGTGTKPKGRKGGTRASAQVGSRGRGHRRGRKKRTACLRGRKAAAR